MKFSIGTRIKLKEAEINENIEYFIQHNLGGNRYGTITNLSDFDLGILTVRFDYTENEEEFFKDRFEIIEEKDTEEYV